MDSRSAQYKRPPVLAAVVFGAVFSAQVQYAPLQAGQAIWFSTPRSDTVSSNVPTLSPKPLASLDFKNGSQIPLPFDLNGPPVVAPPPPVGPIISPAEQVQLQDLSDRRNNWVLLTPAEILGVTTPEKILGIHEYNSSGQPKNLSALERYTERQNQMQLANTNAFQSADSSSPWDFSGTAATNPMYSIPSMATGKPGTTNPLLSLPETKPWPGKAKTVAGQNCSIHQRRCRPQTRLSREPGEVQTISGSSPFNCSGSHPLIK